MNQLFGTGSCYSKRDLAVSMCTQIDRTCEHRIEVTEWGEPSRHNGCEALTTCNTWNRKENFHDILESGKRRDQMCTFGRSVGRPVGQSVGRSSMGRSVGRSISRSSVSRRSIVRRQNSFGQWVRVDPNDITTCAATATITVLVLPPPTPATTTTTTIRGTTALHASVTHRWPKLSCDAPSLTRVWGQATKQSGGRGWQTDSRDMCGRSPEASQSCGLKLFRAAASAT